jgi:hypothetical protein
VPGLSTALTESQGQMASDIAERMGRELPHGAGLIEPVSFINSEEPDSTAHHRRVGGNSVSHIEPVVRARVG